MGKMILFPNPLNWGPGRNGAPLPARPTNVFSDLNLNTRFRNEGNIQPNITAGVTGYTSTTINMDGTAGSVGQRVSHIFTVADDTLQQLSLSPYSVFVAPATENHVIFNKKNYLLHTFTSPSDQTFVTINYQARPGNRVGVYRLAILNDADAFEADTDGLFDRDDISLFPTGFYRGNDYIPRLNNPQAYGYRVRCRLFFYPDQDIQVERFQAFLMDHPVFFAALDTENYLHLTFPAIVENRDILIQNVTRILGSGRSRTIEFTIRERVE